MKILDVNVKEKIEALTAGEFTVENIEKIVKEYCRFTFIGNEEEAVNTYKEWGYATEEAGLYGTQRAESLTVSCADENVSYQETAKIWINEYYTDPGMVAEDYMYELHISIE